MEGAMGVWHIDSYHKLDRYGMVAHGAVDGKTRYLVYLIFADNNRAMTSLQCFMSGVKNMNVIPSHVRGA